MSIMNRVIGKGLRVFSRTSMKKDALGIKAPKERMDHQISFILHLICQF